MDNNGTSCSSPTTQEAIVTVSSSARSTLTTSVVSSLATPVTDFSTRASDLTEPLVAPTSASTTTSMCHLSMPADGALYDELGGMIDDLKVALLTVVHAEKLQLRNKIESLEDGIQLLCKENAYLWQHATQETFDGWPERRSQLEREKATMEMLNIDDNM